MQDIIAFNFECDVKSKKCVRIVIDARLFRKSIYWYTRRVGHVSNISKEKQYFKVTAFYALSLVKYHMKCHAHDSFEIMYVTSGECRIFVRMNGYE